MRHARRSTWSVPVRTGLNFRSGRASYMTYCSERSTWSRSRPATGRPLALRLVVDWYTGYASDWPMHGTNCTGRCTAADADACVASARALGYSSVLPGRPRQSGCQCCNVCAAGCAANGNDCSGRERRHCWGLAAPGTFVARLGADAAATNLYNWYRKRRAPQRVASHHRKNHQGRQDDVRQPNAVVCHLPREGCLSGRVSGSCQARHRSNPHG